MDNKLKIKNQTYFREFSLDLQQINEENRSVALAFSSETPCERWFGNEILSHEDDAIDFSRLHNSAALLVNHDPNQQVGVVEAASLDSDKVARAVVRFGKSTHAQEIFNDVLDGIRQHVSVGYQIKDYKTTKGKNGSPDTIIATRWLPVEISLAACPYDATVGVGRTIPLQQQINLEKVMENTETTASVETTPTIDLGAVRKRELERIKEITALGRQFGKEKEVEYFIQNDKTVDEFRAMILANLPEIRPVETGASNIGLSKKETQQYSFLRAIRVVVSPNEKSLRDDAAFELECSAAASAQYGRAAQGIIIPDDVLYQKRDLSATAGSPFGPAGGFLVGTEHAAASFIELLRNASVMERAGVSVLDGLTGNVAIPKQTGASTFGWISTEGGDSSETAITLGQVNLSPKTGGAFVDITRQLLIQSSPSVETLVRNDLATAVSLGTDYAILYGSGSNGQPTGLVNAGIGSVVVPGSPQTYAWDTLVDLESRVSTNNALLGNLAYVSNALVRGQMKKVKKDSGSGIFLWEGAGFDGEVNGYKAYTSNQVASNDMFFGNWSDVIVGRWSGVDIITDPYTHSKSGTVRVVILVSMDVGVRHSASFARAT